MSRNLSYCPKRNWETIHCAWISNQRLRIMPVCLSSHLKMLSFPTGACPRVTLASRIPPICTSHMARTTRHWLSLLTFMWVSDECTCEILRNNLCLLFIETGCRLCRTLVSDRIGRPFYWQQRRRNQSGVCQEDTIICRCSGLASFLPTLHFLRTSISIAKIIILNTSRTIKWTAKHWIITLVSLNLIYGWSTCEIQIYYS